MLFNNIDGIDHVLNWFQITEFDAGTNDSWVYRNDLMIAHVNLSITSEVANVVIAMTDGEWFLSQLPLVHEGYRCH